MANKGRTINYKIDAERNKKVWIIKTKEGKVLDTFRQLAVAKKEKKRLEKEYFKELVLERDDSIRRNLIKR